MRRQESDVRMVRGFVARNHSEPYLVLSFDRNYVVYARPNGHNDIAEGSLVSVEIDSGAFGYGGKFYGYGRIAEVFQR